ARIHKSPLLIDFLREAGDILVADDPDLPMAWENGQVRVWKKMPQDEGYYGLGDKAGPMNRRDRAFTMWNTDAYAWQESTDPLYKTIPFFMGVRKGLAYGIFFDNTWRSGFDFGKQAHDFYSFGAEGGEINYYVFAGPTPAKIVEDFTALVGRTKLPPLWALGFQQSRYSYEPEERVYEIAKTFRDKKIPADAIYLDIDYQDKNKPFTVNRAEFPTFEKMISDLTAQGFHTVLITDLHIKKDPDHGYAPYDLGVKDDVFVKRANGTTFVGAVWPGDSVFGDFTLSRAREWWGGLYKNFVDMGVSGYGMVGDDIGGFAGSPTPELLTRWIEAGAFNPIYRDHTAKGTADQEIWVHGPQHEAIRKHYIEERYRLLPYIYTSVEEMSRTGIPLMRPLFLEYPQSPEFFADDHEFLFGHDLFISPVT